NKLVTGVQTCALPISYYQLAHTHDLLYFTGTDHTPAQLAMADAAIQSLTRLLPNSGEAHLALAKHLYWGYLDYDRARKELALARSEEHTSELQSLAYL